MLRKIGASDATLRRRMDAGILPKPREFGNRYTLRWDLAEVDAALAQMPRQLEGGAHRDRKQRGLPKAIKE